MEWLLRHTNLGKSDPNNDQEKTLGEEYHIWVQFYEPFSDENNSGYFYYSYSYEN